MDFGHFPHHEKHASWTHLTADCGSARNMIRFRERK